MKRISKMQEREIRAQNQRAKLIGRLVRDAPGRLWEIIEANTGPSDNLYRLQLVGGTYTEQASGFELLHYYTPERGNET